MNSLGDTRVGPSAAGGDEFYELYPVERTRPSALTRFARRPGPWQLLIAVALLAVWQWVPSIPGISDTITFASPFFISSPRNTVVELYHLATGTGEVSLVWGAFARTVLTALAGSAVGVVVGAVGGLLCSNWVVLNRVTRPYVVLLNALPKVAIIPIIVLVAGSSTTSDIVVAFLVVVFLAFFNAFEGGSSVDQALIDNARLLGAGEFEVMRRVRWPMVVSWTFAAIPNAVAFGLVGTVTAELFTGASGLGRSLIVAVNTANADLMFAVVTLLAVTGVVLVLGADAIRRRVLNW